MKPPKRLPATALTRQEYRGSAFTRTFTEDHALECAALEPDGTLVLWSGKGGCVTIETRSQDAVVALVMKSRLEEKTLSTVLEIAREEPDANRHQALMEIVNLLLPYRSPDMKFTVTTQDMKVDEEEARRTEVPQLIAS